MGSSDDSASPVQPGFLRRAGVAQGHGRKRAALTPLGHPKSKMSWGTWPAPSAEHVTLDLGVVH